MFWVGVYSECTDVLEHFADKSQLGLTLHYIFDHFSFGPHPVILSGWWENILHSPVFDCEILILFLLLFSIF